MESPERLNSPLTVPSGVVDSLPAPVVISSSKSQPKRHVVPTQLSLPQSVELRMPMMEPLPSSDSQVLRDIENIILKNIFTQGLTGREQVQSRVISFNAEFEQPELEDGELEAEPQPPKKKRAISERALRALKEWRDICVKITGQNKVVKKTDELYPKVLEAYNEFRKQQEQAAAEPDKPVVSAE